MPVLLYDGTCGLCNGVVRLLIRRDHRARLHFAALQGEAGQGFLRSKGLATDSFDSLVFVANWNSANRKDFSLRTTGVLRVCDEIGGPIKLLGWLRIFPEWLRDPFYRLVAKTRYALFGEYKAVAFTDPDWKRRFL
jgi:predicted DCC family thiol-disulfide oxidoreductase YuxK